MDRRKDRAVHRFPPCPAHAAAPGARRVCPARRAAVPQLHRPPARSRPRRGRRRQPRATGDRAGDRPDHPDPEIQSAAFPQPVTGGGIFLQPGHPIFPRVLRFANDMKSDIRPSLSDMAFCPNLLVSGRPESHIFLAETKTFQFANPRKYGIVCICLKNLKV